MQNRPEDKAKWVTRSFSATVAMVAALAAGPAASSASSASPRASDAGLPSDLARAWHDYDQATIRKDVARLATLVTDDYVLVNSDSSLQDKTSYLADFKVPGFRLDPYEIEQPLRRAWGNTGLTGGVFNLGWTQDGRRQSRRLRFVHVWTEKDGRWRIVYTQLTRVPA